MTTKEAAPATANDALAKELIEMETAFAASETVMHAEYMKARATNRRAYQDKIKALRKSLRAGLKKSASAV